MSIQPREEIERIPPVSHGGFHSSHVAGLIDFSSNVNPFGHSPRVWDAIRAAPIDRHPDPRAEPLRKLLSEIEGVDVSRLIVGNGSVELIYLLAVAFVRSRDHVLIVAPTFGEYAAAASIMGAEIVTWRTRAEENFDMDVAKLSNFARSLNPRLVFLCNPNNPTGRYLSRDRIEEIVRAFPETLLVLDEAFVRFAQEAWDSQPLLGYDNVLILRSLTKDYALTGLRVGYAMSSPKVIEALGKVQPPWSVNTIAQVAAIEALRDQQHLTDSLAALARAKHDLSLDLTRLGMQMIPSSTNFFLMRVNSARELSRRLCERNILVRDCGSFGLPTYVRIAVRKTEDNARLIDTLEALTQAEYTIQPTTSPLAVMPK